MSKVTALVAATILVTGSGCSTLSSTKAARGTGVSRLFPASADEVWTTLPVVMQELKLPVAEENRAEGYLLAHRGWSWSSYGENVAVFVEPAGAAACTKVEVVSKRVLATNVFAPDWELPILNDLEMRLRPRAPATVPASECAVPSAIPRS